VCAEAINIKERGKERGRDREKRARERATESERGKGWQ